MISKCRRSFLRAAAGCIAVSACPTPLLAKAQPPAWQHRILNGGERRLYVESQRTGDVFDGVFRNGDLIYDDAVSKIDVLMRDWRRDEIITIDRSLIDLLSIVQEQIGYEEPMMLISCYRSKQTNDMLRKRSRRVAKNSYHVKGMAVDFRIKGVSTGTLKTIARGLNAGGVGYYPNQRFIHLDTGPIRSWRG